jgi:hypothetical protein
VLSSPSPPLLRPSARDSFGWRSLEIKMNDAIDFCGMKKILNEFKKERLLLNIGIVHLALDFSTPFIANGNSSLDGRFTVTTSFLYVAFLLAHCTNSFYY